MIIKLRKLFGEGYSEDIYEIPDEMVQQLVTLITTAVLSTSGSYTYTISSQELQRNTS